MNDGKGMSIAALVLGILSAIFAWWGLYIGIVSLVCGIVGIVLAVKGKKAAAAAGAPTGMATAGLVLAIIGTSLSVIGVIACGICVVCSASATKGIEDALGSGALDDLQNALDQISRLSGRCRCTECLFGVSGASVPLSTFFGGY